MLTSLCLQVSLYFTSVYFAIFFILEIGMSVYKWTSFPYPDGAIASESILLVLLVAIEYLHLSNGRRGNLTNARLPLVISVLLLIPAVLTLLYLVLWQSYVVKIEVVLCSIGIGLQGLCFLFAVIRIISVNETAPHQD